MTLKYFFLVKILFLCNQTEADSERDFFFLMRQSLRLHVALIKIVHFIQNFFLLNSFKVGSLSYSEFVCRSHKHTRASLNFINSDTSSS